MGELEPKGKRNQLLRGKPEVWEHWHTLFQLAADRTNKLHSFDAFGREVLLRVAIYIPLVAGVGAAIVAAFATEGSVLWAALYGIAAVLVTSGLTYLGWLWWFGRWDRYHIAENDLQRDTDLSQAKTKLAEEKQSIEAHWGERLEAEAGRYQNLQDLLKRRKEEFDDFRALQHDEKNPEGNTYNYLMHPDGDEETTRHWARLEVNPERKEPFVRVDILAVEAGTTPYLARQALQFARRLRTIMEAAGWPVCVEVERFSLWTLPAGMRYGVVAQYAELGGAQAFAVRFQLMRKHDHNGMSIPYHEMPDGALPEALRLYVGPLEMNQTQMFITALNRMKDRKRN